MISIEIAGCRSFRLARCASAVLLGALALVTPGLQPATAQPLLQQCWTPASLASRPDEKPPRRGVKGSSQSIPEQALHRFEPVPQAMRGAIRRVHLPRGVKLVALTFDMCEQFGEVAGYDGAIVKELRARNVPATFFLGGKWVMTHAERARQLMADPRFEMGNHGWAHRNVRGLSGKALAEEVTAPQRAYEFVRASLARRQCARQNGDAMARVAPRLGLYRFPYGACSPQALDALSENGLLAIQWDVSAGDATRSSSPAVIAQNVIGSVRPGSIVLLHANGRGYNTAAALPVIINKLRARGYRFVTVGELLAVGRPDIKPICYDHRPGDTDRYDRLFRRPAGKADATRN
ncbi:MAG: polysaccharide deacetylase family protein [Hyphomicrobiaceae bacterium]